MSEGDNRQCLAETTSSAMPMRVRVRYWLTTHRSRRNLAIEVVGEYSLSIISDRIVSPWHASQRSNQIKTACTAPLQIGFMESHPAVASAHTCGAWLYDIATYEHNTEN